MSRFIDRSNVNGPASADNLREAGVSHIYLKASEGTGFTDATYTPRRFAAAAAGAVHGAYHFADLADPIAECNHFLYVIGVPQAGMLRPALDLERGTPVTDHAWAEEWVTRFHAVRGYLPVLYGSTSLAEPLRRASKLLSACAWWRAEYGPNDGRCYPLQGGNQGAAIHQYTSVARFPGIAGACDASLLISETGIIVPGKPRPVHHVSKQMQAAWRWAQWYCGIGRYQGHGHYAREHGVPDSEPPPLPPNTWKQAWACVQWYTKHGVGA